MLMSRVVRVICKELFRFFLRIFPIKINNYWLYLSPRNVELVVSIFKGTYDRESTAFFSKVIQPGWTIIDIGAYIGYYTIHFSKLAGSKGKIIAFEPDSNNLSILQKNLKLQKINNVEIRRMALGDRKRMIKLYIDGPHTTLIKKNIKFIKEIKRMQMDTLDNLLKNQKADLIKIDTQGYDFEVLQGARKILQSNPRIIIHLEFWPTSPTPGNPKDFKELIFLRDLGFKIFMMEQKKDYSKDIYSLDKVARGTKGGFVDVVCLRGI